jgi:hypothetical protein
MAKETTAISKIQQAHRALELATTIEDFVDVADMAATLKGLMKRRGMGCETMNVAASIKLQAERTVGKMIGERQDEGTLASQGRPKKGPAGERLIETLDELGIAKKDSHKWQQMARLPDEEFEELYQECQHADVEFTQALILRIVREHDKSPSPKKELAEPPEWITLGEWAVAAEKTMGSLDLDPASSKPANDVLQADRYFCQEDGEATFAKDWIAKSVWLCPPPTMPLVAQFVSKLLAELASGNTRQAVLLVNAQVDTGWFREAASIATAIAFPNGKLEFIQNDEQSDVVRHSTYGQCFMYFGTRSASFRKQFERKGCLVFDAP